MQFFKFFILLLLAGGLFPAYPGYVVHLNSHTGRYPLGYYLDILEDATGEMTLDQIKSPEARSAFMASASKIPNFGFSESTYWVRFSVYNSEKYTKEYFLEISQPLLDTINIYHKNDSGKYVVKQGGDNVEFYKRDYDFHNFIFSLPVHAGMNVYYIQIKSTSSVTLDLELFDHKSLLEMMNDEQIAFGFYYGLMVVMLLYNLFIFISIRDFNYLLYSAYIMAYILYQFTLNGMAYQYLWPESVWWANTSPAIFLGAISLIGLLFTRNFLRTYKITPFWDNILMTLVIPIIMSIVYSVFSYTTGIQMGTWVGTFLLATMLITGFVCLRRGDRAARFYVLAWSLFLIGSIFKALQANALIESNFITLWAQQIGSAVDVTLLSLALMDRFNIIKEDNNKHQQNLITLEKKHSESLVRIVEERTQELREERNKLVSRNKLMEYELSLARSIQEKLVPVEIDQKNIAALYKPLVLVGGDFFDIIHLSDPDKTGVFISDVAGHGVQAAFITSMIKTVLLQAKEKLDDPALLLSHINEFITGQQIKGFISVFYGIFDQKNRELTFSNAGHPFPYIVTDSAEKIESYRTIPLGIMDNDQMKGIQRPFKNKTKIIPENSKVVFYTDGLTECTPVEDAKNPFELRTLQPVFIGHRHLPCYQFINAVYNDLLRFRGEDTFLDDVCVICLDVS